MHAYREQSRVGSPALRKLGVLVPEDVEEGGAEVQGHPQPQMEFMVGLGYLRHRKNKRREGGREGGERGRKGGGKEG